MPLATNRDPTNPNRERLLQRLVGRLDRLHQRGTVASNFVTRWRLAIFVAGALCTIISYKLGWYHIGNTALAVFIAVFAAVARYHNRLEERLHRLRLWREIKRTHLARVTLDWDKIPARPTPPIDQHPYALDLDLIGPHSLLHLLDTTVSSNGRERLSAWLLSQPFDPAGLVTRQRLVGELASLSLFRDRVVLEAKLVGDDKEINGRRLHAGLCAPVHFPALSTLLGIQTGLAATTLLLALGSVLHWLPNYWMLSFGTYALVHMLFAGRGKEIFEKAVGIHLQLEKLGRVFASLEHRSYRAAPALGRLCEPLLGGDLKPSDAIRRAAAIMHRLSVRANPVIHLVINAIGPWDLFYAQKLRRLQRLIQSRLPLWLETLAELEAASALATFAYLHPEHSWPVPAFSPEAAEHNGYPATLVARGLGHPLLRPDRRIANDLDLRGAGRIVLITGSNMSGKSTFLRTVGVNVCLAQAGAPVCADWFEWSWVRLACCIRVDDSLEAGLSFFYAEVKRLKTILDETHTRSAPPVLFLIDEIFKGTNNRERLIGSRAYINALARGNGFGLVTTHDLELTELEQQIPRLTNAHFQETVAAGTLKFDYQLRPGPCPTTNALRIMALEGLPVEDTRLPS
ncbi:MAG TPA: hypothetical protein VNK46_00920 [Nitrospiraceae bacterium]|jgi:hypothetical protein|nr:hypothetical protein [Nitrospiraceae bacterium]